MTHRLRCKTAVQLATALLLLGQGAANAWEQEPARSPAGLLSSHRGQLAQAPTRFSPSAIDRLESPYVLGPGDQLQIALFQLPQYSGEHEIQVDGSLNLPLVGQIDVTGLTLDQATAAISNAYSRILKRPIVNLSLVQRRPLTVGIAGEIQRPGSYTLAPANQSFPSLTDLLTTAGGITQSADLRQVQVQRQEGSATRTISVNLWQLLEKGDSRYNISLRDGDSIFIPSTLVPLEQDRLLADASFYADRSIPIDVAVVGEVFRPGPYTVRGGFTRTGEAGEPGGETTTNDTESLVTVTDAIRVAGGIKPRANVREILIRRIHRSGEERLFEVNLWDMLQAGDLTQDAVLQSGDTIIVPVATGEIAPAELNQIAEASFAPDTITVNVVGEVNEAGAVSIPPNTSLNQGILAAGGFNVRAREDRVLLVRLNPDGTVTHQEIEVDFTQGLDTERNPILMNNDVIIVGESGIASFADSIGAIARPIADIFSIFSAPLRTINLVD